MRFAAIRAMAITGALAVMIPLHGATPSPTHGAPAPAFSAQELLTPPTTQWITTA